MYLRELLDVETMQGFYIGGGALGVVVAFACVEKYRAYRAKMRASTRIAGLEGELMAKRGRAAHVRRRISDATLEMMDQLLEKGTITQHEHDHYLNKFGNNCGLTDLLPRKLASKAETVKEQIRERLIESGVNVDTKVVELRAAQKPKPQVFSKKALQLQTA